MTKPAADDIDFDTGLQEVHRRCVAKDVRRHAPPTASRQVRDVPAYDLVDSEAGQRASGT